MPLVQSVGLDGGQDQFRYPLCSPHELGLLRVGEDGRSAVEVHIIFARCRNVPMTCDTYMIPQIDEGAHCLGSY